MDLLQLQYFCAIAQHENITKAARALFVSQPNLSASLSRLEDDLGVKLFDRRRGKVTLTESGQVFLQHVERALTELNIGVTRLHENFNSKDQMRVVSSQTDFIGKILAGYPSDMNVIVKQVRCANLDVYDRVVTDNADFGFYFGTPKTRTLEYLPLISCERVLITAGNHPLAGRRSISINDLQDVPLICNWCRDDADVIEDLNQEYNHRLQIVHQCDDTQVEAMLISSGKGVALSPIVNVRKFHLAYPDVAFSYCHILEQLPPVQLGVVRQHGISLSPAALLFMQKTKEFLLADQEEALEFLSEPAQY